MTTQTTTALRQRPRGIHPKRAGAQQSPGEKVSTLPEYLEAHEALAVLAAAPHSKARLLFRLQWRAGLRVSEAPGLEPADLALDADLPTLRVHQGKGRRSRVVPVHTELQNALSAVLQFSSVGQGPKIGVGRSTAWRWVQGGCKPGGGPGRINGGPGPTDSAIPTRGICFFTAFR